MKLARFAPRLMNGIFAIEKPSGVSSASFLDNVQRIFSNSEVFAEDLKAAKDLKRLQLQLDKKWSEQRIESKVRNLKLKMGHGGTLDPLASGVLIVGIGLGTKKLQYFLTGCNKTYETKALLGISTTTGDSEGEIIAKSPISHITSEMVNKTGEKFIGDLKQTPPIFSALKMNGKPLYDYAREGIPLPKPIKARDVKVFDIKVIEADSLSLDHEFVKLESQLDEETGKPKESLLANNPSLNDSPLYYLTQYMEKSPQDEPPKGVNLISEELPEKLPMVHFIADVSSGTYIRSLVSDFGRALSLSAYMVELIRSRQSGWELGKNVFKMEDFTERDSRVWGLVLKKVFDEGDSVILEDAFKQAEAKMAIIAEKAENQPENQPAAIESTATSAESGSTEVTETSTNESTEHTNSTEGTEVASKKRTIDAVE